jgi:peptide deformylase
MSRKLCLPGNKILKTVCASVTAFDDSLLQLVQDMREIMQLNRGCGLAAPQIGEAVRVIVVQKQNKKGTWAVINPIITDRSPYTNIAKEGCLSYPGIFKEIERPNAVSVKGFDVEGRPVYINAKGFEARILCHEIDHLEGRCLLGVK